jgi:PAS domain S-box-containing protein
MSYTHKTINTRTICWAPESLRGNLFIITSRKVTMSPLGSGDLHPFQTAEQIVAGREPLSAKLDTLVQIIRDSIDHGDVILLLSNEYTEPGLNKEKRKNDTIHMGISIPIQDIPTEPASLSEKKAHAFFKKIGITQEMPCSRAKHADLVPLVSGGLIFGIVCIYGDRPFSDEERAGVSLVSNQIANAIHFELLHQELHSGVTLEDNTSSFSTGDETHFLKDYFETVISTSEDMIYIVDLDGKFVFANRKAKEVMGESIVGTYYEEVIVPEYREKVKKEFGKRLQGKISPIYEIQVFNADKDKIWLEISGTPLFQQGKVVGICGSARDITEKMQIEQQRQHLTLIANNILQRKNLKKIMDTVAEAIHDHCGFGRVIISLLDDTFEATNLAFAGLSEEEKEKAMKRHLSPRQRKSILSRKFKVGQSYYIPHNRVPWRERGVESKLKLEQMKDWHPDDFLFIPLHGAEEKVIGLISVDDPADGKAPTAESLAPVELFATQAAIAIENAWLYEEISRHTELLESRVEERTRKREALLETSFRLRETTSWDRGMKIILEGIAKGFGFENAELFLINEARRTLEDIAVLGKEKKDDIPLNDTAYVSVQCVAQKEPINIRGASTDHRVKKQIEPILENFAWVPIMTQNEVLGAISVYNRKSETPISDEEVEDLMLFASQAAHFVENTRFLISPAVENTLKSAMKYTLEPGESYLIESHDTAEVFDIFRDAVIHGIQGFSICRTHPKKVRGKYQLKKTPILWLSTIGTGDSVDPKDLAKINHLVNEFLKRAIDSVVLLEGIEYLIIQNNFEKVIKALNSLNDYITISGSRLLVPVSPKTLSEKELSILEKEFKVFTK